MEMTFEEFEENYMNNFDGYVPTYFTADEEYFEKDYILVKVEMIAPFRMTDGPSRFFRVISIRVNREQYSKLKDYASNAGENWKKQLKKNIDDVFNYSNKFE